MTRSAAPLLLVLLLACGEGAIGGPGGVGPDPDPTPDPGAETADALYDPDHLVEVVITMDEADAEALAAETNNIFNLLEGADCMDAPWSGPFNWYPGDITVDGEFVQEVGLRKKGLIGSLSSSRPSFKVKFDKFVEGQSLGGLERLTLNNSISDASLVKQCLGYALFEAAGVPAPRCNFAHVTVRDWDLGVYVNVEPPKKRFLRRVFDGHDEGDLYEGTLSDFRPGWTNTFEPDTSSTDPSRAPVVAVSDALLLTDDDEMLEALEQALDMEAFHRFWAMEVLIAHWDGYTGNRNNFYVYRPDGEDQLQFVPWGIDGTMSLQAVGQVTQAAAALPRRLWSNPDVRARQLEVLEELLDQVWDEDALQDEIDRMVELVDPYAPEDEWRLQQTEAVRSFVDGRRDALMASLEEPLPTFDQPLGDSPCLVEAGELAGELETTWGTLASADPLSEGWSQVDGQLHGDLFDLEGAAVAGLDGNSVVMATLAWQSATVVREVILFVPTWLIGPDPIPLGGFGAGGYLVDVDVSSGEPEQIMRGSLWNGSLQLTQLDGTPGGPVSASFESLLYDGGP